MPVMNLVSFTKGVEAAARRIPNEKVKRGLRGASLAAYRVAVKETPKDTGFAQYNWQTSEGAPNFTTKGKYNSKKEWPTPVASAEVPQLLKAYSTMYITNNAPYIEVLNDGGIYIDPQRMVERARLAAQAYLRGLGWKA